MDSPLFVGWIPGIAAGYGLRMKPTGNKVKSRKFVLRPFRRIQTWYGSYYMSGNLIGRGVVTNLSRTGMRVRGDHSLKPGTDVSLRITVEEHGPPLEIARASVQWANQYEFGVKIQQLSETAAHRIAGLIKADANASRNERP